MEAIAGLAVLGVACNVMQTIQFSLQAASLCKSFLAGKSPNDDAARCCNGLQKAVTILQDSVITISKNKLDADERELETIAADLASKAQQLGAELDKWRKPSDTSKIRVMQRTLKYALRGRNKIKDLDDSVRRLQHLMESHVLVGLRKQLEHSHTQSNRQFDNVNQQLLLFVSQLREGHTRLDQLIASNGEIKGIVRSEAMETRIHIDQGFLNQRSVHDSEARIATFLRSLWHPEMNARRSAIYEANNDSYRWIFTNALESDQLNDTAFSEENRRPWDSFTSWLESDHPVYWISGKAGSGKSSLVRFLTTDNRTRGHLNKWRSTSMLLAAFIWCAGTPVQRSQTTLFASILHQLLSVHGTAATHLLANMPDSNKTTLEDWSKEELLYALEKALLFTKIPVCIFVDGLDEIDHQYHGGKEGLLKALSRLASTKDIKLCLGSREEREFVANLGKFPRLRLQDLTEHDMRVFVTRTLSDSLIDQPRGFNDRSTISRLTDRILSKAEGVFLWVHLVTMWIREGLYGFDDYEQLEARIDRLLPGLEGLYIEMWNRLHNDKELYRNTAALCFTLVLRFPDIRFAVLLLSLKPTLRRALLSGEREIAESEIIQEGAKFHRQLLVQCAGFLESPWANDWSKMSFSKTLQNGVQFVHRSANDFLKDTIEGKDILSHCDQTKNELEYTYTLSYLAGRILPVDWASNVHSRRPLHVIFGPTIHQVAVGTTLSPTLEFPLLRLIDRTIRRQSTTGADVRSLAFAAYVGSIYLFENSLDASLFHSYHNIKDWKCWALRIAMEGAEACWTHLLVRGAMPRLAKLIRWLLENEADINKIPGTSPLPGYWLFLERHSASFQFFNHLGSMLLIQHKLSNKKGNNYAYPGDNPPPPPAYPVDLHSRWVYKNSWLDIMLSFFRHRVDTTSAFAMMVVSSRYLPRRYGHGLTTFWPINRFRQGQAHRYDASLEPKCGCRIIAEACGYNFWNRHTNLISGWIDDWNASASDKSELKKYIEVENPELPKAIFLIIEDSVPPAFIQIDEYWSLQLHDESLSLDAWHSQIMAEAQAGRCHTVGYDHVLQWFVQQGYRMDGPVDGPLCEQDPLSLFEPDAIFHPPPDLEFSLSGLDWSYYPEYDELQGLLATEFSKRDKLDSAMEKDKKF